MRRTPVHPINQYIQNGYMADLYLNLLRTGRHRFFRRILEHVLHTQIACPVPQKLHVPHPFGVIAGWSCRIAEDVTLMQFCLLGPKDPWYQGEFTEILHPKLEEGVYVSAGAAVLGPVTVGAWSVIGANAVVTEDVPPFATVFGNNRILRATDGGPPQVKRYLESRQAKSASPDKAVPA